MQFPLNVFTLKKGNNNLSAKQLRINCSGIIAIDTLGIFTLNNRHEDIYIYIYIYI